MKNRGPVVAILLLIAAAVWGWNLIKLFSPSLHQPTQAETLPEVPAPVSADHKSENLPALKSNPFHPKAAVGTGPQVGRTKANRRKPKVPEIPVPRGQLHLLMENNGQIEGLYSLNGEPPQRFKIGDNIGEWVVEKMTLETVELKHATGKTHILNIY